MFFGSDLIYSHVVFYMLDELATLRLMLLFDQAKSKKPSRLLSETVYLIKT
jgi:hypothetical protein